MTLMNFENLMHYNRALYIYTIAFYFVFLDPIQYIRLFGCFTCVPSHPHQAYWVNIICTLQTHVHYFYILIYYIMTRAL